MTRLAAYLGPPTEVGQLLEGGTSPLIAQVSECPDGFAAGWYPAGDAEPVRLADRGPISSAEHHLRLLRRMRSSCVLATVRRCWPNEAGEIGGCQPLADGRHLFASTGRLTPFRDVFERPLRERLGAVAHRNLRGTSQAELLFATWLDILGKRTGPDAAAEALDEMVSRIRAIAHARGATASFGVVVTDGQCVVALRTATNGAPPPLVTVEASRPGEDPAPGRILSSEPLFVGRWSEVEPDALTIFTVEQRTN